MPTKFHELPDEELSSQLEQFRSELRELRFNFAIARTVQSPARFRMLKKDIARILTIQTARTKGIATQKPATDRKAAKK